MQKLFINGNVYTVDKNKPRAEAFVVENNRFLAVGSTEEILKYKTKSTEVIDLQGVTVLPGLNDSHIHLMGVGRSLEQVNLASTTSREELVKKCIEFINNNQDLDWILGRGWNQAYFADRKMPSRHDLDKVCSYKPVYLRRACGHISVANTCALEMAGLMKGKIQQPNGGHIDLDENGVPTGILRENACGIVAHLIPKAGKEDYKRCIIKGANLAASLGLTSVQSNDLSSIHAMDTILQAYQEVQAEGSLPIRVNHQVLLGKPAEIDSYMEIKKNYNFPEHTVTYGPLKLMTDGSLGGRTALMHAPYSDDYTTSGMSTMSQEEINETFKRAHSYGLQLAAHAIGDLAIQKLLNAYKIILTESPVEDARPRIIHAQITNPHILEQMKQLAVVCDIQPIFVPTDMHFVEQRLGKARASQTYPWKTMREMGIVTAGGSDSPVEPCNPILGIAAAVTRQDINNMPENGWRPEEKLTPLEAIELFTKGSAYAEKAEKHKGEIKKGLLADFITLNKDIVTINSQDIKNTKVTATYVGGKQVY
ncbi:amidohydrolase [Clostridium sp. 'deep sea']|uniref:amidohydrolase n=1 Tax=Clostridium sp. 'deep sea' TaxID=2779445 RepID=UPI0018967E2B|nr:amidohydrolase [Clostridium sp. 'deep sea']QOR36454.1 amidohydrolase [Clostridium sp. 'deep sea']